MTKEVKSHVSFESVSRNSGELHLFRISYYFVEGERAYGGPLQTRVNVRAFG